jgi:hypothetical protein
MQFNFKSWVSRYANLPSKVLLFGFAIAPVFLISACGSNYKLVEIGQQYQSECFGDITAKCRNMQIDVAVASDEVALDTLRQNKEKYIKCRGRDDYDELLSLVKEHEDYLESLRPNFFIRHVLSSMNIEPPDIDGFPDQGKMIELTRPSCHSQLSSSTSPITTPATLADIDSTVPPASSAAAQPTPNSGPDTAQASTSTPPDQATPVQRNVLTSEASTDTASTPVVPETAPTDSAPPSAQQMSAPEKATVATAAPAVHLASYCGWISDEKIGVTLVDKTGTHIVGDSHANGQLAAEIDRNHGEACGCIHGTMNDAGNIDTIAGYSFKPLSVCKTDKSINQN